MREGFMLEDLESQGIRVQGVIQLRSGRRDQDPPKDRPRTTPFIVSVARGPELSRVRTLTELRPQSRWRRTLRQRALYSANGQRFGHTQ
jgi:hypothetical protein